MNDFVDPKIRYKLQREFKKAQKKAIKEYAPKIGEKAAKRLVKLAARRLNARGIEDVNTTTNSGTDISDTDTAQPADKGFH
jgi:kynurenine formamidase